MSLEYTFLNRQKIPLKSKVLLVGVLPISDGYFTWV